MESKMINLKDLSPSSTNPRKNFPADEIKELAKSIEVNGVQVPIIARQSKKGYEIIDGERRYRACKEIGIEKVNIDLRTMSDQEVIEFQLMTFLHRKDITPIEEANAYLELSKQGVKPETIAARVAKPESHIIRILRLLKLIPAAKKLFDTGVLPLGHALEICRLQPVDQEKVMEFVLPAGEDVPVSLSRLKGFIEDEVHLDLRKISFSKTDPKLVEKAGPCTHCPKRSGFNQGLFPDIQKADTCTDPACFKLKVEAHIAQEKSRFKANKEKVIEITPEYSKPPDHPHAITFRSYKEVKGKPCKYSVNGIAVAGSDRGKIILICNNKACSKHWEKDYRYKNAVEKNAEKKLSPAAAEKKRIEELKKKITQEKEHQFLHALEEILPAHTPSVYDKKLWIRVAGAFLSDWDISHELKQLLKLKKSDKVEKLPPKKLHEIMHLGAFLSLKEGYNVDTKALLLDYAKDWKVNINKIKKDVDESVDKEFAEQLKPMSVKVGPNGTPEAQKQGTCRICGCTEESACSVEGDSCSWVNDDETLCDNPTCVKAAAKQEKENLKLPEKKK